MRITILSGTPGTGKTSISKEISKMINATVISLNELVISENIIISYDEIRETSIINELKLLKRIKKLIKGYKKEKVGNVIIESHFSDIVPSKLIDYAIVLRCDPDVLLKRLELRGYKKEKIIENVQSEILGTCANFLLKKRLKKPVIEISTSEKNVKDIAGIIVDLISERIGINNYKIGKIDWFE
jgi:adenylate kinase